MIPKNERCEAPWQQEERRQRIRHRVLMWTLILVLVGAYAWSLPEGYETPFWRTLRDIVAPENSAALDLSTKGGNIRSENE